MQFACNCVQVICWSLLVDLVDIQDGEYIHEWVAFILEQEHAKSWGQWRQWGCEAKENKGAYMNSWHRVGGNQQCEIITIWGNRVGVWWKLMVGFWSYHRWGGWPDVHWVLVLAQNTEVEMDAQGCQVLLLVPSTKVGMDTQGCVTRACDRTQNWSEFAERCMTGLGTRVCQGVWLDSELARVCQEVWSLKAKDQSLSALVQSFVSYRSQGCYGT